ncbi:unnamed protein product [Cunninghamella blakesleeana]
MLDPFPRFSETLGNAVSNPRIAIFSIVMTKICLDCIYGFAKVVNPNGALDSAGNETLDILEYHHPWTSEEVYGYLSSYGNKGRLAYQSLLIYDCGFLLFRTLPLCLLIHWAFSSAPPKWKPGLWIPLACTFIDLLENMTIWMLLKLYPTRLPLLGQLTAYLIQLKWYFFWFTIALVCVSSLVGIYFSFHNMLSNSVLLEKDRQDKLRARRHVTDVLERTGKSKSSSSSVTESSSNKKKQ